MASLTETFGLVPAPPLFAADYDAYNYAYVSAKPAPGAPRPSGDAPPLPYGLQLLDFQAEGVRFLLERPAALLGDEMGLGKSVQAIAAMRLLVLRGEVRQALVLCPKTLLFDWLVKLRRWAPELKSLGVEGPKNRRWWSWRCAAHVYICGYESWRRDGEEVAADSFDLVVLDEVQKIKNATTLAALSVQRIEAAWRWGLSGTPMENKAGELVAVFNYLVPGLLQKADALDPDRVRERVRPYLLRRRKAEVLQSLPPKHSRTVWLDLPPAQRAAYNQAEREGLNDLAGVTSTGTTAHLLALLGRLKQLCNYDPESGESAKLEFLQPELEHICGNGEKALVFSQYPEKTLMPLLPRLGRFSPALFHGQLKDYDRAELVCAFQEAQLPRVLCISLKAGGTGLTLTRANHVYHFDQWWNFAAAGQAEDRVHRIGQTRPVFVTNLLTKGTVEERIMELLERKRDAFTRIVDDLSIGEGEASGITQEDLRRLFALSVH